MREEEKNPTRVPGKNYTLTNTKILTNVTMLVETSLRKIDEVGAGDVA